MELPSGDSGQSKDARRGRFLSLKFLKHPQDSKAKPLAVPRNFQWFFEWYVEVSSSHAERWSHSNKNYWLNEWSIPLYTVHYCCCSVANMLIVHYCKSIMNLVRQAFHQTQRQRKLTCEATMFVLNTTTFCSITYKWWFRPCFQSFYLNHSIAFGSCLEVHLAFLNNLII